MERQYLPNTFTSQQPYNYALGLTARAPVKKLGVERYFGRTGRNASLTKLENPILAERNKSMTVFRTSETLPKVKTSEISRGK